MNNSMRDRKVLNGALSLALIEWRNSYSLFNPSRMPLWAAVQLQGRAKYCKQDTPDSLHELNQSGQANKVIDMIKSQKVALDNQSVGEYVKALISKDLISAQQLVEHLEANTQTPPESSSQTSEAQVVSKQISQDPNSTVTASSPAIDSSAQAVPGAQQVLSTDEAGTASTSQSPQQWANSNSQSNTNSNAYQYMPPPQFPSQWAAPYPGPVQSHPPPPYPIWSPWHAGMPFYQQPPSGGSTAGAGGNGTAAGAQHPFKEGTTQTAPVFVQMVEPGWRSQLWSLAKSMGSILVVILAVRWILDERVSGSSVGGMQSLHSPDLKPQDATKTRLDDVKGVDEAKNELSEIVQNLKYPDKFTKLGGKLTKGVLLVGPPGNGKTMLARAIAGEAGVPFFYSSGSEFDEMFVGVGARRVRELFGAAKTHAPCIVFIDEIDAIGGSRSRSDQVSLKMTLNQLLVELDGFQPSDRVLVVAATNFPELLDKALVRPGRFDRHIVIPTPDQSGRKQILDSHFVSIKRHSDVDLSLIARGTPGFSGADLANLVNIAALQAAKMGRETVNMECLEYARDRIMMGQERTSAVQSEHCRKITAYHEGGHALVAMHTSSANPVHKATIVPRGAALGMVTQLPGEEEEQSVSKSQLMAQLVVAMGGRVAEELIFGDHAVTTGASSDLQLATSIARDMVMKYGMSERIGKVAVDIREPGTISPEMRKMVEEEVGEFVSAAHKRARDILVNHTDQLHVLAAELLSKGTLTGSQIKELLGLPQSVGDIQSIRLLQTSSVNKDVSGSQDVVIGAEVEAGVGVGRVGRSPRPKQSEETSAEVS